ncbi:MAG: GTPase [Ruminococcaceae bacterium]|jgi:G3E family GTPase|nr:GTPase [Oscillospiraceae bacterium]
MIEIPVYIISGFLDAGKTTFIKPMLVSEDFTGGDKTLFLVCEEGEEEYDPARLRRYYNVAVEYIENEEDLTTDKMRELEQKYKPDQVLVEYNGMWSLAEFEQKMPPNWRIYQLITLADANTFDLYTKNLGAVMMEKLMAADMIIINRCTDELAKAVRKRNLKMVNRRAQIYLDFVDGHDEEYDDGSTPPFDLSGDMLELNDEDFGVFYVDAMDHPERYDGKKVRFKGMVAKDPRFPKGSFVAGRFAMVCCAEDTTFLGLIVIAPQYAKKLNVRDWVWVTAEIKKELVPLYDNSDGPMLYATHVEYADPPAEELVYF